ncbi:MAG: AGE family epimerase/isomerase, partial [Dermabacter sp.]|nr:AGE family epimerase/isomerase [Dermabacter sp.]
MTTPLLLEETKTDPAHAAWLEEVGTDLLEWGAASRTEHGFGWLDSSGTLDPDHDLELWINCRMTHCFALASIRGTESSRDYAELAAHGLSALSGAFHDDEHGGFYSIIARETGEPVDDSKQAYAHAFVVLAASSLVEAKIPGAGELLETALEAHARFFESEHGMFADTYSRDFSNCEDYRGINANMHSVE